MRAPLLSLRVVGADCLHGTGLALVSQFFTVFGSLMFVVQEVVAKNNAATEDLNGKRMISFLIIFANAAAGGLYPLYRFLTAWAESGDIDFGFITSSIQSGAEKCLGPEVVASLLASCACLRKAKETADEAEAKVRRLRATAEEMRDEVRQHELVRTPNRGLKIASMQSDVVFLRHDTST